jgi:hypothetical protein
LNDQTEEADDDLCTPEKHTQCQLATGIVETLALVVGAVNHQTVRLEGLDAKEVGNTVEQQHRASHRQQNRHETRIAVNGEK